ncbi:MAG: aldo/keto reductase family protein [Myxococcota bacterium]|nr:aldo/keto reductase family protein [Myxococcales bacterium]
MRTRRLGDSGLSVGVVSLGSWLTFGESVDVAATSALVAQAVERGVDLFDTADVYANGEAERALATALRHVPRHRVVLASKCFFPMSHGANDRGLSRKHVFESVEASLRRLGTDYLDLHQCHRFDPTTPLDETVRAYEDLIRQGKVLYWGTSLWSGQQIARACEIADATGGYRPISNQPVYSILRRGIESEVLPRCRELGVGQIVFSPLGQGVLTGKYSGGARPPGSRATDERLGRFMKRYLHPDTLARVDALAPIAADLGLGLPALALAFCLRDTSVASVIVGATRAAQLDENCRAAEVDLPDDAVRAIDALFPPGSESLPAEEAAP